MFFCHFFLIYFLSLIISLTSFGSPIWFSFMVLVVTFSFSVVVTVLVSLLMYWSMSFLVELLSSGMLCSCVVIVLLMCFQFALWHSLIVFCGLGRRVSSCVNVAVIMLWSSSTPNSTNFFVISGEENIRSLTSCAPVLSLV